MQFSFQTMGMPGDTFTMTSTNSAQSLTAASIVGSSGHKALGAVVSCETNAVKFCVGGSTPVSSGLGHTLSPNQSVVLESGSEVVTFEFISATADSHGVLQITPFFEFGRA